MDITKKGSSSGVLALLQEGKHVALVSDAGTPRVSDPGYHLIRTVFEHGYQLFQILPKLPNCRSEHISYTDGSFIISWVCISKAWNTSKSIKKTLYFSGTIALFESVHRVTKLLEAIEQEWILRRYL